LVFPTNNSISLNARLFANIEGITTLVHEIGHIILKGIKINPKKPLNFERIAHDRHDGMGNKQETEANRPDPLREALFKEGAQRDIWEEVWSDLFVFKLCFAPLELTLFGGELNQRGPYHIYKEKFDRKRDTFDDPRSHDISDDFTLAWIFNLLLLPKVILASSRKANYTRLGVCYGILKLTRYRHKLPRSEDPGVISEEIWNRFIIPLFETKLPSLLDKIRDSKLVSLKNESWQDCRRQYKAVKKEIIEQLDLFIGHHETSAAGELIEFLASRIEPDTHQDHPLFQPLLLKGPLNLFELINGLLPNGFDQILEPDEKTEDVWFACALQMAGIIYLGFVQDWRHTGFSFIAGYPGFDNHREQKSLAKSRQMLYAFLINGTMAKIKKLYETKGFPLRRFEEPEKQSSSPEKKIFSLEDQS
jgi:hypothetical protein